MWRSRLLLTLCFSAAAGAAETGNPFPLGVYWPWERLCGHAERLKLNKWQRVDQRLADLRTGKRLAPAADGAIRLRLAAGDGTLLELP